MKAVFLSLAHTHRLSAVRRTDSPHLMENMVLEGGWEGARTSHMAVHIWRTVGDERKRERNTGRKGG